MNLNKLRAQDKIVSVNDRLGNDFLKRMQGTTKMAYDTLEVVPGQNVYQFFKDSNSRSFPFCNVKSDSLPVAESLAVQRISLAIVTVVQSGSSPISAWNYIPLQTLATAQTPLLAAELSLKVANDVVMKPITIQHFLPEFNKNATNEDLTVFEMNTDLIIPPQLDFSFELRTLPIPAISAENTKTYIRLVIEGVGAQFNGKANF